MNSSMFYVLFQFWYSVHEMIELLHYLSGCGRSLSFTGLVGFLFINERISLNTIQTAELCLMHSACQPAQVQVLKLTLDAPLHERSIPCISTVMIWTNTNVVVRGNIERVAKWGMCSLKSSHVQFEVILHVIVLSISQCMRRMLHTTYMYSIASG